MNCRRALDTQDVGQTSGLPVGRPLDAQPSSETGGFATSRPEVCPTVAVPGYTLFTPPAKSPRSASQRAFSLLEVMIAGGMFFMAVFAILAMVSGILRNARSLRLSQLDAGMVAAQVCNTNKLTEGGQSGDFGNLYPGYSWEAEFYEAETNGLWQVDIVVRRRGVPQPVDAMSIYLFRPDSQAGFGRPNIR